SPGRYRTPASTRSQTRARVPLRVSNNPNQKPTLITPGLHYSSIINNNWGGAVESISLEQMAYLSDIISGLAVAVTLIFLVYQMAKNNRRLESDALREIVNDFIRSFAQATETSEKASNFRNGLNDFNTLPIDEQARFHSAMLDMTAGYNQVLSLYEKGLLDKPPYEAAERVYMTTMKSPGAQQWWKHFKHIPPDPLVDYITKATEDSNIRVGPAHDELPWLKAQP
ncbi:MAG: hypothetical protein O7G83_19500, partial [Proteobacteria bacterium]|nr:hypothetical protein [Pseudomonadota bacterium]